MDARYTDSNENSKETTGYTHGSVMEMCKSQNWEELKYLLCSSIKDLSYKILATAVFEAHHPDEQERKEYGLSNWNNKLRYRVLPIKYLFYSRVGLFEFCLAYTLAIKRNEKSVRTSRLSLLEDSLVAEKIKNYVQEHKSLLGGELRDLLEETEDVKNQEAERQRQLAKQREKQINCDYYLCKKADKKLEKLFSLTKGSCEVYYCSTMMAYNISFIPTISLEDIKEYIEILKNAGLKVSYFFPKDFPKDFPKNIQLHNTIQEMVKALDKINNDKARQSFLNIMKNSGSPLYQRKNSDLPAPTSTKYKID